MQAAPTPTTPSWNADSPATANVPPVISPMKTPQAMNGLGVASQCFFMGGLGLFSFSVCCIEVSLLADSQEVHEYGEPGDPEDCHHHVDGPMPEVAIAEGEVGSRDGSQAGG